MPLTWDRKIDMRALRARDTRPHGSTHHLFDMGIHYTHRAFEIRGVPHGTKNNVLDALRRGNAAEIQVEANDGQKSSYWFFPSHLIHIEVVAAEE